MACQETLVRFNVTIVYYIVLIFVCFLGSPGFDGLSGIPGIKGQKGDDCLYCPPAQNGTKGDHGEPGNKGKILIQLNLIRHFLTYIAVLKDLRARQALLVRLDIPVQKV